MKIAVCDDDGNCVGELRKLLYDLFRDDEITIESFNSGEGLIGRCGAGVAFDVIFLDIQLGKLTGLEAAHFIRQRDKNVIIVFLTNYEQYVFRSFQIEAFDYIMKPIDRDTLDHLMKRVLKKYRELHYMVSIKLRNRICTIEASRIVCVEGYKGHLTFQTIEERIDCVGKLDDYEAVLRSYGFLRCHQGFLINMKYIRSIERDHISTTMGQDVDMSVRKKAECLQEYNRYITGFLI